MNQIVLEDCLLEMRKWPSDSVDLCVTDPPYGISFMGKHWDIDVPSVEIWSQVFRVLKDGSFLFAMSSPRQDVLSENLHRIHEAGFDTNFTSLYWCYVSGFPKSANIAKLVDKRLGNEREIIDGGIASRTGSTYSENGGCAEGRAYSDNTVSLYAHALDGSYAGFQPKPAVEIIIVAMKPLSEKSYVDQALKNGKGITWLDEGRIPFASENDARSPFRADGTIGGDRERIGYGFRPDNNYDQSKGRFPANLLVSDDALNDGKISIARPDFKNETNESTGFGQNTIYEGGWKRTPNSVNDSGSFSRYFSLDAWWSERIKSLPENVRKTFPFLIEPKADSGERNEGLESLEKKEMYYKDGRGNALEIWGSEKRENHKAPSPRANFHPSVKPIQLMSYLITLGSRENDIVLDPFLGSGTTCLAAIILNRKWIGIEKNPDYHKIALAREQAQIAVTERERRTNKKRSLAEIYGGGSGNA